MGEAIGLIQLSRTPLRAVFDTNVVVSALIFGKRLDWVRTAWNQGSIIPVVCRETVRELIHVLGYSKFALTAVDRETILADYLPFAETFVLPNLPPAIPPQCRDRTDVVFLLLTLAARLTFS